MAMTATKAKGELAAMVGLSHSAPWGEIVELIRGQLHRKAHNELQATRVQAQHDAITQDIIRAQRHLESALKREPCDPQPRLESPYHRGQ